MIDSGTEQYPAVIGYYLKDPDGRAFYAVPIEHAGEGGENLAFLNPPESLVPKICQAWADAGQMRTWIWGPKQP